MQETKLAQYLADCFGIRDQRLQNWGKADSSGCLGEEVKRILNSVCAVHKNSPSDLLHFLTYLCYQNIEGHTSPLSITDVDTLLAELASHSGFSHVSIRNQYTRNTRRRKCTIFRALYRSLSPIDASFLTQIILKDLRPLLYPLSQTHYTTALKQFNSASVKMLTKEHAMLAWDPSRWMLEMYRVRSNLHDAAAEFERSGSHANAVTPKVGTPIEVFSHSIVITMRQPLMVLIRYPSLRKAEVATTLFIPSGTHPKYGPRSNMMAKEHKSMLRSLLTIAHGSPSSARVNGTPRRIELPYTALFVVLSVFLTVRDGQVERVKLRKMWWLMQKWWHTMEIILTVGFSPYLCIAESTNIFVRILEDTKSR